LDLISQLFGWIPGLSTEAVANPNGGTASVMNGVASAGDAFGNGIDSATASVSNLFGNLTPYATALVVIAGLILLVVVIHEVEAA
jgi:hypothetical protein